MRRVINIEKLGKAFEIIIMYSEIRWEAKSKFKRRKYQLRCSPYRTESKSGKGFPVCSHFFLVLQINLNGKFIQRNDNGYAIINIFATLGNLNWGIVTFNVVSFFRSVREKEWSAGVGGSGLVILYEIVMEYNKNKVHVQGRNIGKLNETEVIISLHRGSV